MKVVSRLSEKDVALPDGWCWVTLENLVKSPKSDIVDGPFGSNLKASEYVKKGVPIVRIQNVDRNRFVDKNIQFVTHKKAEELRRHNFHPGDILITKLGDPLGKACIVPDSFGPGIIVADIVRLHLSNRFCSIPYLAHAINSDLVIEQFFEHVKGTTRPRVNLGHIRSLKVPLAPLDEQKRIVAKVEQLLARVNVARRRLAKVPEILKRFRQSVLAAACSGRLTADWREIQTNITPVEFSIQEVLRLRKKQWVLEKGSAKKYKLPQTVRTDTLPIVPEDWEYVSSDALFSFVTSGSRGWAKYYSESGSTFIRIGNLDHDTITLDLSQIKRVNPPRGAERQRTRVQPEDILISITADVGMIALVPNGLDEAYVNQHVAIARPVHGVYRPWLAWYLASTEGGQAQFQNLQRGATKVGLGLDDIRSVPVPFPPVEEQQEIVRRIEVLFKMADAIERRVAAATVQAENMTQAILAKAFRGELVPTEAELAQREGRSYEPAFALLAKIEAQRKDVKPQRKRGRTGSRQRKRNK